MAPCALNIPPFIEKTALDDYSDGIIFCCLHASWVYMYFLFFSIVIMMSLKKRACSQLALPKQIKVKKTRICNDCSTFIDYSGNNWGSMSCRRILVTLTCRLQGAGIIPNPWMACPAPEPVAQGDCSFMGSALGSLQFTVGFKMSQRAEREHPKVTLDVQQKMDQIRPVKTEGNLFRKHVECVTEQLVIYSPSIKAWGLRELENYAQFVGYGVSLAWPLVNQNVSDIFNPLPQKKSNVSLMIVCSWICLYLYSRSLLSWRLVLL